MAITNIDTLISLRTGKQWFGATNIIVKSMNHEQLQKGVTANPVIWLAVAVHYANLSYIPLFVHLCHNASHNYLQKGVTAIEVDI